MICRLPTHPLPPHSPGLWRWGAAGALWMAAVIGFAGAQEPAAQDPPSREPELPSPSFPAVPSAREVPSALPAVPEAIIKSIEVRSSGTGTVDRNRVLSNMSLKVGTAYTQEKSDEDVKNLVSSGVAANVNIIPEASGDGIKLTVIVEARTTLGEVLFLGNSSLTSKTLEKEIDLKTGVVVDEAKLQEAQTKIREAYQKKGFPDVEIRHQQEKMADTGFTRVTFYITEGQKSLLNDIRFEGNTVFSQRELRKLVVVGDRDWWRVWNWTKRINSEKLEKDVNAIQDHYQNAGYMNAKVVGVDRVPVRNKVDVVFRIFEGGKFEISGVGIEGMAAYPKTELEPSLELTAGEPYSAGHIKSDLKLIHDYYGSRGYADVDIRPRITRTSPSQLNVVYVVTEGQRSYIRKINIKGNQNTRDEVIRRELAVVPGEEFNTTKLNVSRTRLENLGYFEPQDGVEFFPVDTDTPGYKDIDISVREKSTGQVQFGAGFSSIDDLIGIVELSQTNFDLWNWPKFTGAGQKFRTRVQYGTKRRDIGIDFTEPWFLGQRLRFDTELYYRDLLYLSDYYDENLYGGAVSLSKATDESGKGRLRAEYRLQNVSIEDVTENASEAIKQEEGDFLQSTFSLGFIHDTRDVLLGVTRKGHKFQVDSAVSGLGGDVETYEFGISGAQYFSLPFDTVFKLEGAFDTIDNYGGDRVPIFQRKFLGGSHNLRGFEFRDVGPKDENGETIGGKSSVYFTAEYNFPIIWKLRGVVFGDIGNVGNDFFSTSGDWNSDVGFGLHLYNIPQFGTIGVDLGFPVSSDEFNDDGPQFNINMGYQF
jgi:outer membrane protein insertion porin family